MMALTLGMGGGLGALFGKAALKNVVLDRAVNFVCRRNMTKTFNAMAAMASSPAGSFIAEQSWNNLTTLLTKRVVDQVEGLVTRPPLGAKTIQNPQVIQNDLRMYLLRAISSAHKVAAEVRDHLILNDAGKDQIARDLRSARLFSNAPTTVVVGPRDKAAKDIELSLYMVLIMDSDYINETTFWQQGARDGIRTRRVGSVNQRTTSQNYPTSSSSHTHGFGHSSDTIRTVEYDSPGSRVMDRINALHKERFHSEFLVDNYGRDEVMRAEQISSRLQKTYLMML